MRKLTDTERKVIAMIGAVGGSVCPDAESQAPDRMKILNDLVKKHRLLVESTDAGPRFTLTTWGWEDA